ncbi:MAG: hypothetical protein J0H40_18180 [Rhizobiales bacterium]|nr:hypothetical protein [Hyphomicrobiales bacterium]
MSKKIVEAEPDFTTRVLMSLVVDVSQLAESVERVKAQVFAMAKENGVALPTEE